MSKQRPSRPQVKNVRQVRWSQRLLNTLRKDPYYWLLIISWNRFLLLISLLYLGVNFLFALAYLITGNGIANARTGSFADAFFFSVQTIFTVGYGSMYPQTVVTQILMMAELMIGVLLGAMATGLMFARFSLPTARVIFSRVAVVCPFDGTPTLMFRTANQRENQIVEANVRVNLLRNEVSTEGHQLRRFYDLQLLRHQTPAFSFSWLIMHPIVESSPLYGATAHSLAKAKAEIWVTVTGLDETFSQTIHARHSYATGDVFWSMRFVDIFHEAPDGRYVIDLSRFHDIVPLEPEPSMVKEL